MNDSVYLRELINSQSIKPVIVIGLLIVLIFIHKPINYAKYIKSKVALLLILIKFSVAIILYSLIGIFCSASNFLILLQVQIIRNCKKLSFTNSEKYLSSMHNQSLQNIRPLTIDGLQVHTLIGQGGQAKVYLCTKPGYSRLLSVKVYELESSYQNFEREVNILSKLNHENIIKLESFNSQAILKYLQNFEQKRPIIVSEFVYYGQLSYIAQIKDGLSEKTSKYLFKKILQSLEYLHNFRVSHRDVKLQNILLDQNLNIKLIDFALSTSFEGEDNNQYSTDNVGTQYYKAPQLYNSEYSCQKIDIFAAGVLLFCMLFNRIPFKSSKNSSKQYEFLRSGNDKDFWKFHIQKFKKKFKLFEDEEFKKLMTKFFNHDPSQRPNFQQLSENLWLNTNVATQKQVKEQILMKFQDVLSLNKQISSNYNIIDDLINGFKTKLNIEQINTSLNQEMFIFTEVQAIQQKFQK